MRRKENEKYDKNSRTKNYDKNAYTEIYFH